MAVTRQDDRRKGNRRQSGQIKGDIEKITIRGERYKEQEVVVRHEAVPEKAQAQCGAGMRSLQQN
jgi:hypothetical protein